MLAAISQLRRSRSSSNGGFSLIENMLACTVIAIGLAGTYAMNSQTMSTLRMAKDEACASQVLQQRVEQLRIANWQRITNPTWISRNLLNVDADGSANLTNLSETITVTPYNSATTSTNSFTRSSGSGSYAAGNSSLLSENAVTVKWSITWKGIPGGRVHKRETLAVLGKGGVAK